MVPSSLNRHMGTGIKEMSCRNWSSLWIRASSVSFLSVMSTNIAAILPGEVWNAITEKAPLMESPSYLTCSACQVPPSLAIWRYFSGTPVPTSRGNSSSMAFPIKGSC